MSNRLELVVDDELGHELSESEPAQSEANRLSLFLDDPESYHETHM